MNEIFMIFLIIRLCNKIICRYTVNFLIFTSDILANSQQASERRRNLILILG